MKSATTLPSYEFHGKSVGSWRLIRLLGSGGASFVYEARTPRKRGALKLLRPELTSAKMRARFLGEVRVARTLSHPAAVSVLDVGETRGGLPYFVMDLLKGDTLESVREARGGTLSIEVVKRVATDVLDFLRHVHARGVVHRDIKPTNLFQTSNGELKVLDFGIAGSLRRDHADPLHTEVGTLLGTPAFMSPEQARGYFDEVDARSDLWSVGATLFTLLTGRHVHESQSPMEQLCHAMTRTAPSIAKVMPELPEELRRAIDGALAYERVARWQSASEMLDVLSGHITREPAGGSTATGSPFCPSREEPDAPSPRPVRLFVDRARSAEPELCRTGECARSVAEGVTWLDGLPLAIEIAVARLGLWTPRTLRERIGNRLETLGSGAMDLPATLRNKLEWSFERLYPLLERVLRRLGCSAGPFSVGAARVLHREIVRGAPRLSPHVTVREFAGAMLTESGAAIDIADPHLAHHAARHAARAEELEPSLTQAGQGAALCALRAEASNLRAAPDFAVEARAPGATFTTGLLLE